ncbi:hypothetical protein QW131_31745 [Roseibium salinum]|nr:hypothetical protein [Roseibium salinum]
MNTTNSDTRSVGAAPLPRIVGDQIVDGGGGNVITAIDYARHLFD